MRRLFYFQRMILFTTQPGPRIACMAQWLGERLFGHALPVMQDEHLLPAEALVLNYTTSAVRQPSYQIIPSGLLVNSGTARQTILVHENNGLPIFFETGGADHAFDLLAAAFYLLSRYEEYQPFYEKDEYGRYSHTNSIAYQHGFLKRPIADEWIEDLKRKLSEKFGSIAFANKTATVLSTCDVDLAWSYRNKGLLRNAGGWINDWRRSRWHQVVERLAVLAGFQRDPFEILSDLEEAHAWHQIPSIYFFLLASENKGYDKNISPHNKGLQAMIRRLQEDSPVGIHFSWAASQDFSIMQSEKKYMEQITRSKVDRNRMHYVNFRLPETFQQLLASGITKDYSMGYGTINGFRAGTSHPYHWYDLAKEECTDLRLYPFAWMDANSIFEQQDDPETAFIELMAMFKKVQATGGTFITIVHNHLMGLDAEGRQWWLMYNQFLKACGAKAND